MTILCIGGFQLQRQRKGPTFFPHSKNVGGNNLELGMGITPQNIEILGGDYGVYGQSICWWKTNKIWKKIRLMDMDAFLGRMVLVMTTTFTRNIPPC